MLSKLIFILGLFLFNSCAATFAPPEYVPTSSAVKKYPYGSYIIISMKAKELSGEFIGISEDKIFVRKELTVYFVPISDIKGIKIYNP